MTRLTVAAIATALLSPPAAPGAALTLDEALERARREAPAVAAARLRIGETEGRLAGATPLLHHNPELEGWAGRRSSDRGTSADVDAGLSQTFELGGRRGARIAGARADVERETAAVREATRQLVGEVASAFLRGLAAEEQVRVLRASHEVALDLARMADSRHRAGDIADLDVNLVRAAASRRAAEVGAAEARLAGALADLQVALGLEASEPLALRGDLRTGRRRPLDELLVAAAERPDLQMLAADVRAAEAETRLGEGFAWPELGVRVGYRRDEDANIPGGGLAVSLPVFARGQELRATGSARASRLRVELAARRRAVEVEVRAAFTAHERLRDGVQALERDALPRLDDSDALARRSYEAGEMSLLDYLIVRRETLGTRLEYVERSLDAALAGVALATRAGVSP